VSSELSLFHEFNTLVEVPTQAVFDWDAVVTETKDLRRQEEELAERIKHDLTELNDVKLKIGLNLLDLQEARAQRKSGDFIEFALKEFDITSVQTVYDYMHVAKNLEDYLNHGLNYPWRIMRLLGQTNMPKVIVEQVIEGTIEATPKAIKEAKQALLDTTQKLEATQRELQDLREHSKTRERNREQIHVSQILAFKESEDKLKLERDQIDQQLKALREQTANGAMSPEAKEQLDKLQAELDDRTKQRDNLAQLREKLSKELDEQRDANKARQEQEMYEHRINDRVKKITEEWGKCSVTLLGQLPSPIESQVVTGNNWALLDHASDMAQKIIDAVKQAKISKDAVFLNSEVESNAL
jgi:hypothetical protein